jgi:quercetin dioxygenase-like cupin family protein
MKDLMLNMVLIAAFVMSMLVTTEVVAQEMNLTKATPEEIKWSPAPPFLPAGAQFAVIKGDPGQPGPFTIRLSMPAGYKIPLHKHTSYEHITVLSGTLYMSEGEEVNATANANGIVLPVGSFAYGPGEKNHAAWTTDEGAIIQIQSQGPFEIHYVNPNDDPRSKKQANQKQE